MKNENIKNARKTENQWNVCNLKVHSNFSSIKKHYTLFFPLSGIPGRELAKVFDGH